MKMKKLKYQGFDRQAECAYAIGEMNGTTLLVFKMLNLSRTSITNVIEDITSEILRTDLRGVDPAKVRFFEYYPPSMEPLRVWQEVTFGDSHLMRPKTGILQSIWQSIRKFFGKQQQDCYWVVSAPNWLAVDAELQKHLAPLVR
jgi:hypothetical protein